MTWHGQGQSWLVMSVGAEGARTGLVLKAC